MTKREAMALAIVAWCYEGSMKGVYISSDMHKDCETIMESLGCIKNKELRLIDYVKFDEATKVEEV